MPPLLPSLLVDTGPLVSRYLSHDREGARIAAFLREEEGARTFGRWVTTDWVVGEAFTFLRREETLARAQEFLAHLDAEQNVSVLRVPWSEVSSLVRREPAARLGHGFTFVDASLVAAARQTGAKHVFTVNPRDFRPFGLHPMP